TAGRGPRARKTAAARPARCAPRALWPRSAERAVRFLDGSEPEGRAVDAQRDALLPLAETGTDEREGLRGHERRRGTLEDAPAGQDQRGRGEPAQQRGEAEPDEPGQDDPPPPGQVADAPTQRERDRIGRGVGGHHLLAEHVPAAEVVLDGGDRETDDEAAGCPPAAWPPRARCALQRQVRER